MNSHRDDGEKDGSDREKKSPRCNNKRDPSQKHENLGMGFFILSCHARGIFRWEWLRIEIVRVKRSFLQARFQGTADIHEIKGKCIGVNSCIFVVLYRRSGVFGGVVARKDLKSGAVVGIFLFLYGVVLWLRGGFVYPVVDGVLFSQTGMSVLLSGCAIWWHKCELK